MEDKDSLVTLRYDGLAYLNEGLRDKGYFTVIGGIWQYDSADPLPYRLVEEGSGFQIYYEDMWYNAVSVDWDLEE